MSSNAVVRPMIEAVYLENVFPWLSQIFGSWVALFIFLALVLSAFVFVLTALKWRKRPDGDPL